MVKIYSKKRSSKIQKKGTLKNKSKKYRLKSNSQLIKSKRLQTGGFDMYGIINFTMHSFLNHSDTGKALKATGWNPDNWASIVLGSLTSSWLSFIPNFWITNALAQMFIGGIVASGSKGLAMIPFDYAYSHMKESVFKYHPERIPIKKTWFMKIISLVNGLFNKVFKSRYSLIVSGGLSLFLFQMYFYPKENTSLLASKLLLGVLMICFLMEIFLDNNLLQFCHSELKKDIEENKSGGNYTTKNYKGSGVYMLNSSFCTEKINDKVTIMLLNLKQRISGINQDEDLLLQKKTKTGYFKKRQISAFKSFKLECYKFFTSDKEYEDELKSVPLMGQLLGDRPLATLGQFGNQILEMDAKDIQQQQKQRDLIETVKKEIKDEKEHNKKYKNSELAIFDKELEDDDILNQVMPVQTSHQKENKKEIVDSNSNQSGGNIVSGLLNTIFLTIESLCKILKYEVNAIKSFIIACLNICLKLISKGYNGLRIFYILLKKCFIPLTLLTIMLFLHLKFGQKIKQYLKSKILG